MKSKSRREFLTRLGITVGAIAFGKKLVRAFPIPDPPPQKTSVPRPAPPPQSVEHIDFRYAPKDWQSTYCFPDDAFKSIVGKMGDLRYAHEDDNIDVEQQVHIISAGLRDREQGTYIEQKFETPAIPIVTTMLGWDDLSLRLVSFATNHQDEGRVDNLLVEYRPKQSHDVSCAPEIVVKSTSKFLITNEDNIGVVRFSDEKQNSIFLIVNSTLESRQDQGMYHLRLPSSSIHADEARIFLVRLPRENQPIEKIKDRLRDSEKLLTETRTFWQSWKTTEGKVSCNFGKLYQDFAIASARNITELREVANPKQSVQSGNNIHHQSTLVADVSILEASRLLGYDSSAQHRLETIWNNQNDKGLIVMDGDVEHLKDTAAAVYALVRQAESSQNWEYFNELYPDAHRALMALQDIRDKTANDGTPNGKYKIMPREYCDCGIPGIHSEFTTTIWTLIALKTLYDVGERFSLVKTELLREFYASLLYAFLDATKLEMRTHPKGFNYLPMLLKDDPLWTATDKKERPSPQVAQFFMSQYIYPGFVTASKQHPIVSGHLSLLQEIIQEDVPIGMGKLSNEGMTPFAAPIAAQVLLWAGMKDTARRIFIGFLNHSSPLFSWSEEESLQNASIAKTIGDMPHAWASAECIRYLRQMMVLEDEKELRLFAGLALPEITPLAPISLVNTPTKWGKITATLEPIDVKHWGTTFLREEFDAKSCPKLEFIVLPDILPNNLYLEKVEGADIKRSGHRVLISPDATSWKCTWRNPLK